MQYLCNYQLHRLLGLPSTFQVNFDEQCIFLLDTNHTLHCDIIALDAIFADRDGRIKVIGGGGIEGLLISPKQLPYKYIEVCIYTINYESSSKFFVFTFPLA